MPNLSHRDLLHVVPAAKEANGIMDQVQTDIPAVQIFSLAAEINPICHLFTARDGIITFLMMSRYSSRH